MNFRVWALAAFAFIHLPAANAQEEEDPGFTMTVGLRETYDDNLYRLPEGQDPSVVVGPDGSRIDYLSRVSLGLEQEWQWSRQTVIIDLKGNHDAYKNNDHLDNTSGEASAEWQWEAGGHWAGEFGADYRQSLANFANTQFLGRDMVETVGASWMLALRLGPQWSVRAAGRHADTEHSAAERQFDNFGNDSASVGLQFTTSSENEFALSYRATRADFDQAGSINGQGFDRDFEERSATFRTHYAFSEKTAFDGSVGYLEREYPATNTIADARGSFSGVVWDVAFLWDPSIKVRVELSGWRKLRAYLDAESDYFIAEGASIATSWHPTDRFAVSLEAVLEDQDYLGTGVVLSPDPRNDRVWLQELTFSYRMLRKLHFDLTGRIEDRDSDRAPVQYETEVASVGVRWVY
jgi:hypothetical protein